jgi:hypothetical protein
MSAEIATIIASEEDRTSTAFDVYFSKFTAVRLRNINIKNTEAVESVFTDCHIVCTCPEALTVGNFVRTIRLKLVPTIVYDPSFTGTTP